MLSGCGDAQIRWDEWWDERWDEWWDERWDE
jgi:hypothetical protein